MALFTDTFQISVYGNSLPRTITSIIYLRSLFFTVSPTHMTHTITHSTLHTYTHRQTHTRDTRQAHTTHTHAHIYTRAYTPTHTDTLTHNESLTLGKESIFGNYVLAFIYNTYIGSVYGLLYILYRALFLQHPYYFYYTIYIRCERNVLKIHLSKPRLGQNKLKLNSCTLLSTFCSLSDACWRRRFLCDFVKPIA